MYAFIYGGLTHPSVLRDFAVRAVEYVRCYLLHYELCWNIAARNDDQIINPFSYHGQYILESSGETVNGAIAFLNIQSRRYRVAPGLLYEISQHDLERLSWRAAGMYERIDVTKAVVFPSNTEQLPDLRDAAVYAFQGTEKAENDFQTAQESHTLYITRQYLKKIQDAFVSHDWALIPPPENIDVISVSWKNPVSRP